MSAGLNVAGSVQITWDSWRNVWCRCTVLRLSGLWSSHICKALLRFFTVAYLVRCYFQRGDNHPFCPDELEAELHCDIWSVHPVLYRPAYQLEAIIPWWCINLHERRSIEPPRVQFGLITRRPQWAQFDLSAKRFVEWSV